MENYKKVGKVLREFKKGELHSGRGKKGKKGKVVKSRKQAIAIALSEAGMSKKIDEGVRKGLKMDKE